MSNVDEIKDRLENTNRTFKSIAEELGVSARTVSNINMGITHKENSRSYPIRMGDKDVKMLRSRLSKPQKSAVLHPQIISPQLLDYIGFLSILEVPMEEVLITFTEVFLDDLISIIGEGESLGHSEVYRMIKLEPRKPESLNKLIEAYKHPKVKMLNTSHWISTGLITKGEASQLHKLFN